MESIATSSSAEVPQFTLEPRLGFDAKDPRAEEEFNAFRAELAPQLARLMTDRLVQALLAQRGQLLQTQEIGALRLEEFEQRVTKIQEQLLAHLEQYAARVHKLEMELASCEAINTELIRKNVVLARKAFDTEQRTKSLEDNSAHADFLLDA